MKILTLSLFFLLFFNAYSQEYKLMFDYDSAGNQYHKHIVFNSGRYGTPELDKDMKEVTEEEKEILEDGIKYFPNPVKDLLFVYWTNSLEREVKEIYLLNISGKTLYFSKNLNEGQISISLSNYTNGVYILSIVYNDGESKSYKIIKN